MCKVLKISRKTYYNYKDKKKISDPYEGIIKEVFNESHKIYGTRKIKAELERKGIVISRRRISRIMKRNGLESVYQSKKYKNHKTKINEQKIANILNRDFNKRYEREVLVSDLTYVRVANDWNYICLLLDLSNREIAGYSCGKNKDAKLVKRAFAKVKGDLRDIQIFHTDRGSEFDNYLIDETLKVFGIERSLSTKGCPYDNAVAESTFKIVKTEFVRARSFRDLEELENELEAYVNWFNNKRIHSSLGYKSPAEYRRLIRQKSV